MEVETASEPVFDKENVAPPVFHAHGKGAKESDDHVSTSKQIMGTSTTANTAKSATPAEGGDQNPVKAEEDGAESGKKKRKRRKKKKKKKTPSTEVTPEAEDKDTKTEAMDASEQEAASASVKAAVEEKEASQHSSSDEETPPKAVALERPDEVACEDVKAEDESSSATEAAVEDAEKPAMEVDANSSSTLTAEETETTTAEDKETIEDESPKKQKSQEGQEEAEEEGDEASSSEPPAPPPPPAGPGGDGDGDGDDEGEDDGSREDGEASHSDMEAENVLEEEYLTVDEDAPSPLSMAVKEEGEIEEDDDTAAAPEVATPFVEPSEEMMAKIVKQMEFYFSDANILKDYFLLRRIRKNKEGWLRVSLLAGFKLIKSITPDWRQVAFAIRQRSELLELDEEGIRVRRKGGLPEWDHHVYKRTCLVFGFDRLNERKRGHPEPSNISVSFVRDKLFGQFGDRVKLVRILKPGKEVPLDLKTCVRNHKELGTYLCAVVEFDTIETAETARRAVDFKFCQNRREWSKSGAKEWSHLLTVKILGKRTREPLDIDGYMYGRVPHPYYGKVHPRMHYPEQQPQQHHPKRAAVGAESSNTYADKVRGRKRPAPETYADRVKREPGSKPAAEEEEEVQPKEEQRQKKKLVPIPHAQRQRRRHKQASTSAESPEKKEKEGVVSYAAVAKSVKEKVPSYAEKAKTGGGAQKRNMATSTEECRDEATQTMNSDSSGSSADQRRPVERTGLIITRPPRGPPEEGNAVTWNRTVVKKEEPQEEPQEEPEEEVQEPQAARGLQRRRSVRELVLKFEALSADEKSPTVRRSGSLRLNNTPLAERKEEGGEPSD